MNTKIFTFIFFQIIENFTILKLLYKILYSIEHKFINKNYCAIDYNNLSVPNNGYDYFLNHLLVELNLQIVFDHSSFFFVLSKSF